MTDAAEPLIVAAIRRRPTGLLHHKPQGVGGTGTTAAGFLREYDDAIAAAEARGARRWRRSLTTCARATFARSSTLPVPLVALLVA